MRQLLLPAFFTIIAACNSQPQHITDPVVEQVPTQAERGAMVFNNNCGSCHNRTKDCGYRLTGVLSRWPDITSLKAFIRNSTKVIESGDPYAVALYDKWKATMPAFPEITDQEMDDLIVYINQ